MQHNENKHKEQQHYVISSVAPIITTGCFMLIYAASLLFLIFRIRAKFTKQIKFVLVMLFLASIL